MKIILRKTINSIINFFDRIAEKEAERVFQFYIQIFKIKKGGELFAELGLLFAFYLLTGQKNNRYS
ncbi:MAG TPA: hypothetical protein PL155_04360 [Candidatus Omnitrophota bacterium]|nr:hypothetical protein [Candidatus Omnitrophota bacterium]HPD84293.1 hypothetical protein [Candidatus Omnitrophota bacterium]HRZ03150.1 hypothetical protein [Candidatus Omnitrophota bacterium]